MGADAMNAFTPMDAADGAEIFEPCMISTTLFSGVRMHLVGGVAHLLFYAAQPPIDGRIEFHLVARMVAPAADAKLSLDRVAKAFTLRPLQSSFVPEGERVN
jgi:hypothetical protein